MKHRRPKATVIALVQKHRPPRIAMTLVAMAALLHLLVPLDALPSAPLPAAIVGGLGFAIMLRAWWLFRIENTAICPTARTTTLITRDVYVLTRNPMYLGMVMMLAAIALLAGALPFYIAAVLYFLLLNAVFCPYEEQKLRATFDEYANYASRVRRWI